MTQEPKDPNEQQSPNKERPMTGTTPETVDA
jgi:hypothetical protein